MAIFGHRSEASLRNYISRPSIEKIRACSDIRSDAEGHISHCSRVSRRCHPERSLCSGEFGCRSFTKHSPWNVCFPLVMWKNLRVSYEPQFGRVSLNISLSDSVLETKRLHAEVLNYSSFLLLQNVNFDGLTFLTALVLYSQSDSNRDSDWLIVARFVRV